METVLVGGQVAKNNTTQHDATEVGRGNEGSNKLAVAADQAPLIKRKMKIMHAVSYWGARNMYRYIHNMVYKKYPNNNSLLLSISAFKIIQNCQKQMEKLLSIYVAILNL